MQFITAAMNMQLIKDGGVQILVTADEKSEEWIGLFQQRGPERWLMRKLQRYSVNVSQFWFAKLKVKGDVQEVHSGIYALASPVLYHEEFGLLLEGESMAVQDLVV